MSLEIIIFLDKVCEFV